MRSFGAIVALSMLSWTLSSPSWGADAVATPTPSKVVSKEDREKMAVAHEQMAACLRSDQDLRTCHDALRKECQPVMGEHCFGMGPRSEMHRKSKNRK